MKNELLWEPTKYVLKGGKLVGSSNRAELAPGSRLIATLVAGLYQTYLPQYASGELLDIGCGRVPLFGTYRRHVTSTTCVDWQDNPHIDVVWDLIKPLPFNDSRFQTVIMSDVLEHIPEPTLLWRQVARIMAAGGHLLLNVPFYYWLHEKPHDYYRYTEWALRKDAAIAGFNIVLMEPVGGSLEILTDIIAKHLAVLPGIGTWLSVALQHMTLLFVRTPIGKRLSARTSRSFPLGYFLVAQRTPSAP